MRLAPALVFVLAGCATSMPDAGAPAPGQAVGQACVSNKVWSAAEQDALAAALASVPAGSIIWTMEFDWQAMRDANAACAKVNRER